MDKVYYDEEVAELDQRIMAELKSLELADQSLRDAEKRVEQGDLSAEIPPQLTDSTLYAVS